MTKGLDGLKDKWSHEMDEDRKVETSEHSSVGYCPLTYLQRINFIDSYTPNYRKGFYKEKQKDSSDCYLGL